MSGDAAFRLATPEEVERFQNPSSDDHRYYDGLQRSARAEFQKRDAKGRFSSGYEDQGWE